MALGLPDKPPLDIDFDESPDDEHCPHCGWDAEPVLADPQSAFNSGNLYACEQSEGSPYTVQSATTLLAYYIKCPNGHPFTLETEQSFGAMA